MTKFDDYVAIILTSDMTEEQKIAYLKILNKVKKYTPEQLKKIEDKIYTLEGEPLSEKDRIIYEINYLNGYYKNRDMDLTEVRKLYFQIRSARANSEDITKVKINITKLQLENCLNIRFYSAYLDLLKEKEKQNMRKIQRTLQ